MTNNDFFIGAGTTDAATSPIKLRKRTESLRSAGSLCTESCKPGDLVLVMWDNAFQNFKILQDSTSMYFLNADCNEALGLRVVDGVPSKLYCYGEVVDKEFCHARKVGSVLSALRLAISKGNLLHAMLVCATNLNEAVVF